MRKDGYNNKLLHILRIYTITLYIFLVFLKVWEEEVDEKSTKEMNRTPKREL